MSKVVDRSLVVMNVVVFILVLFVLLRPGGIVREGFANWRLRRATHEALVTAWPDIAASRSRLDRGGAPVTLVEFGDYQCPYCRHMHAEMDSLTSGHRDVGVVFINFPLPIHPMADWGARAALCAADQGRFVEMDRELYETSKWQSDTNATREARTAGIPDLAAFGACLKSLSAANRIAASKRLGDQLHVSATPTFASKGGVFEGTMTASDLLTIARGGTVSRQGE